VAGIPSIPRFGSCCISILKSAKHRKDRQLGAALIEFALMALVLYLLIAGSVELGRMIFVSQILQDAARIAARELSVTPLPAGYTFDCLPGVTTCALADPTVEATIWDPTLLVIDISCDPGEDQLEALLKPVVNRALRPVMISDSLGTRKLLRYPGALLSVTNAPAPAVPGCPQAATDLTVSIPQVASRDAATGVETTIHWVPVLSEVRADPSNPASGQFSAVGSGSGAMGMPNISGGSVQSVTVTNGGAGYASPPTVVIRGVSGTGATASATLTNGVVTGVTVTNGGIGYPSDGSATVTFVTIAGIAAIAVNYPFQAAALSGFQRPFTRNGTPNFDANGAPNPNAGNVIDAQDASAQGNADTPPPVIIGGVAYSTDFLALPSDPGTYSGSLGLGNQLAFAKTVRPYRSLLLGQALFRREVIQ
jgi:hypothetical protein